MFLVQFGGLLLKELRSFLGVFRIGLATAMTEVVDRKLHFRGEIQRRLILVFSRIFLYGRILVFLCRTIGLCNNHGPFLFSCMTSSIT